MRITEATIFNKHAEECLVHSKCSIRHELGVSPQPHPEFREYSGSPSPGVDRHESTVFPKGNSGSGSTPFIELLYIRDS